MDTKLKIRDELKAFVKHEMGTEIEKLPPTRQSKAMARFYVERIRRTFNPGLVPADPDDLQTCLVDGEHDCGVDFVSRSDGTVLIVQAKFRGYGVNEKLDEIVSFGEVLRRLHPETGKKFKKNSKLAEALAEIDWDNDTFDLAFISLGRLGPNLRAQEESGPMLGPGLDDLKDRCGLTLYEESDLNVELREAISAGETISQPVTICLVRSENDNPWVKLNGTHGRSIYIGFVKGSEIAELYRPHIHRFRLFALNIRDWIGETSTNKGIIHTAQRHPDDFLFFKNGISAVATSIDEDDENNKLSCRNFSIINDAQTVRSLFRAQSKNSDSVKRTTVMVRISTFSLGKEPAFLDDVTRYNNTQNKVSVSDFRSNDPVQRDLAQRFSDLKRDGRHFWYKNKRSREKRDRIPIEMEEFTKTLHAFQFGPHDMWGGTSRLFDPGKEGRYARIFGDGESVWSKVPEDEFPRMAGIWFLCEFVRSLWKEKRAQMEEGAVAGLALERRYIVYYAVSQLLRMTYQDGDVDLNDDLRRLGKPRWTERDGHEKDVLKEVTELALVGLVKAYESASKAADFRHRNWFRDRTYLKDIDSELKFIRNIRASVKEIPRLVEET